MLGKAYGMSLVVIVDDYSMFISKVTLGWEEWQDKWITIPFKTRAMGMILVLIVGAHGICQQNKRKENWGDKRSSF